MAPMFTALAPSPYAQEIGHAFLILSNPTNDPTQLPATHNYVWLVSQTHFDLREQIRKTLNDQQVYLSNRRFFILKVLNQLIFSRSEEIFLILQHQRS